jgi:hypothetical protein
VVLSHHHASVPWHIVLCVHTCVYLLVVRAKERFSRLMLNWPYGGGSAEVRLVGFMFGIFCVESCLGPALRRRSILCCIKAYQDILHILHNTRHRHVAIRSCVAQICDKDVCV